MGHRLPALQYEGRMRLRARLIVTTTVVSVPMVFGLFCWDTHSKHRAAEDALIEFTLALVSSAEWLNQCEIDPIFGRGPPWSSRHGGMRPPHRPPYGPPPLSTDRTIHFRDGFPPRVPHRRPTKFVGYDATLTSRHREAPHLSPEILDVIGDSDAIALRDTWWGSTVRVLVRSPGSRKECAYILAEGTTERWRGGILPASQFWLLPLVAVIAAILISVGPVVHRIRRLTIAVLRSVDSEYERVVSTSGNDEVAELGRAFEKAARTVRAQLAQTRRKEAALRDFLVNTTHDIMIPLTVLQGHLAELHDREREGDLSVDDTLASAMNEAHYLGALVHNLSIVAKLDAADAVLQPGAVDLEALIERVVSRHRPIAARLGVSVDRAAPVSPLIVHADVTLLEQAVGNIVYNAIRYNHPGGHVAVIAEHDGKGGFVLNVIDDGPGLLEESLERLVERGFREDYARTRSPDGQGLGLHIAHRVTELHGFRLSFRRSEYGGLHVTLSGLCGDRTSVPTT